MKEYDVRGFKGTLFEDSTGTVCEIQHSSFACSFDGEDTEPRVWFGVNQPVLGLAITPDDGGGIRYFDINIDKLFDTEYDGAVEDKTSGPTKPQVLNSGTIHITLTQLKEIRNILTNFKDVLLPTQKSLLPKNNIQYNFVDTYGKKYEIAVRYDHGCVIIKPEDENPRVMLSGIGWAAIDFSKALNNDIGDRIEWVQMNKMIFDINVVIEILPVIDRYIKEMEDNN